MSKQQEKKLHQIAVLLFFLYIILLCYFLFFSEGYGRLMREQGYRYNLKLFYEIKRFWVYRHELGFKNVCINLLGNMAAFAPFGFFLPILKKEWGGLFKVAALTLMFSFTVETLQLVCKVGAFDVDDLLLNTVGGMIGYCAYLLLIRIFCRRKSEKKE